METFGVDLMFCIFVQNKANMSRMEQLQGLLKDDPEDLFILFAIGKEYEKNNDFNSAIAQYENIVEIDETYVGVYYHLAHLYAETGKTESAYQAYEKGIGIAKKIADFHAMSELLNAKKNLEMEEL